MHGEAVRRASGFVLVAKGLPMIASERMRKVDTAQATA